MVSLLFPDDKEYTYKQVSDVTMHDLGLDQFVERVTKDDKERHMIMRVLSQMSSDSEVTKYRCGIFADIYNEPEMCEELLKILDKINFLREYGTFKKRFDEAVGIWDLLHKLEEINDYISYVEAIYGCLKNAHIESEGLNRLKDTLDEVYHDKGFDALKEDISRMKASTSDLKSVTVGVNLNERFEAVSIGLISVNNQFFTKSGLLKDFCDKISSKEGIKEGTEWKENYKYHQYSAADSALMSEVDKAGKVFSGMNNYAMASMMASVPANDSVSDITKNTDQITDKMLSITVRKLRDLLNKYVSITISDITNLIPEIIYYVRFADYIRKLSKRNLTFSKAMVISDGDDCYEAHAKKFYNLKLTADDVCEPKDIVLNDIDFDKEHMLYILTGANRGGKTTVTQAVGQLFVLAQGGIFVPAESFSFKPVDCLFTHFPADEDKTVDLGRLGEECKRFKEIFYNSTDKSLVLLNETFSTTSFEEGYFIARDSVRALLRKGVRTLYNTHMHKLAYEVEELNEEGLPGKAVSLIVSTKDGKRSFRIEIAPPEGMSFARDIAEKYGVTYEMLNNPPVEDNK